MSRISLRNGVALAAVFAALCGCNPNSETDGGNGLSMVRPSEVTVEALRAAADPRVHTFYEARGWRPAWTAPAAARLIDAIGGAGRHGLSRRMFLDGLDRATAPAARDAALTLAALTYAEALARGRIDPTQLGRPYTIPRPAPDLGEGLDQALAEGDVADWLASLAPQDEEYTRLADAYAAAVVQAVRARRRVPIPDGPTIEAEGEDPRLAAIAVALAADGYYEPAADAPPPARLTPELMAAVQRIQEDYGLTANGAIDANTLAAINEGAFERARALAVNLERRRWLRRQAPTTRIDVNTAAATLEYWRDGEVADRRKVVVGQPGNETPEIASPFYRLVANPTWTVPRSIEEEEIAQQGPDYLARNNMERRDGWIVQRSGPTNALGLVKFDMRNDLAIYLHDTPAKTLFDEDERHASHGCVRVQDALGFARMLAEQEGVLENWQRALATNEEAFVPLLRREIPVRLIYHTAFVDGDHVRYRLDTYGWDDQVARALGLAARAPRPPRTHLQDIGP